jgi:hypothetical protein
MSVVKTTTNTPVPYLTLIQAPDIPGSEVTALKAHYQEAIADPSYAVVLNYEARVDLIEAPLGTKLLVTAPGIPVSELKKLRTMVAKARKATQPKDRLVVVNYYCRIDAIEA